MTLFLYWHFAVVAFLCELPYEDDSAQVFVFLVSVRCVRIYRCFINWRYFGHLLQACYSSWSETQEWVVTCGSKSDMRDTLIQKRSDYIINYSGLQSEHNCRVHSRNWDTCTLITITKSKVLWLPIFFWWPSFIDKLMQHKFYNVICSSEDGEYEIVAETATCTQVGNVSIDCRTMWFSMIFQRLLFLNILTSAIHT